MNIPVEQDYHIEYGKATNQQNTEKQQTNKYTINIITYYFFTFRLYLILVINKPV